MLTRATLVPPMFQRHRMLVVGGRHTRDNTVYALDFSTMSWSQLTIAAGENGNTKLPPLFGETRAIICKDQLVVFGNGDKGKDEEIWRLDLHLLIWTATKCAGYSTDTPFNNMRCCDIWFSLFFRGRADGLVRLPSCVCGGMMVVVVAVAMHWQPTRRCAAQSASAVCPLPRANHRDVAHCRSARRFSSVCFCRRPLRGTVWRERADAPQHHVAIGDAKQYDERQPHNRHTLEYDNIHHVPR